MSHKATNWLAGLPPERLSNSEFRVLFHLCDCHNPSEGCFPSQAYLIEQCAVSNGTVNNALNTLEAKGLILRHRTRDGKTKRQCPTRYILGFEMKDAQEPTPKTGDGKPPKNVPDRLQSSGDGAVSKKRAYPSPKNSKSRLQPTGEEPVKEPVKNRARDGWVEISRVFVAPSENPMIAQAAARKAAALTRRLDAGAIAQAISLAAEIEFYVLGHIIAAGLLSDEELAVCRIAIC